MAERRFRFTAATALLSVVLFLVLAEMLLRVAGFTPWRYSTQDAHEPTMHEPDGVLGWRGKAGTYVLPPYAPAQPQIHITTLEDGSRRTGAHEANRDGTLLTVGGSFTQGWAISDEETYAWKLQDRFPSLKVVNFGTAGYGSLQSLLVLENELPRARAPRIVVYGFIEGHERRNVATARWLRTLSMFSRRAHVSVPYATLDEDTGITRHLPRRYPAFPMREYLATAANLEFALMSVITRKRESERRKVTEQLLLDMHEVCAEYDAPLIVALLHFEAPDVKEHYVDFLRKQRLDFVDCVEPLTPEMKVPGEGHPNGAMNTVWADCIAASDVLSRVSDGLAPRTDRMF
jgi:hypothetical protein